jgi:hypothetical protein
MNAREVFNFACDMFLVLFTLALGLGLCLFVLQL